MSELTPEQMRIRQEAIRTGPRMTVPEQDVEDDDMLEEAEEPDTFFDNVYKPPETVRARFTGTEPKQTTETVAPGDKKTSNTKLNTDTDDCRVLASEKLTHESPPVAQPKRKVRKSQELTDHCPYFYINEALANCKTINWTEKALLGILNFYSKWGYASVSFAQLAHYLDLAPRTVENLVSKLENLGFLIDEGDYPNGKHRLVVCLKWRNPPKKKTPSPNDVPF